MGEMADYFLEEVWEFEDSALEYRLGNMEQEEAYDRGIIDEMGYEILPSTGSSKNKEVDLTGIMNKIKRKKESKNG